MLLYIAIISYILSLVVALILVFTSKKFHPASFRMMIGVHVVLGAFFLFSLLADKSGSHSHLSFLFFFCSGIITSGLAFGMNKSIAVKAWFGLFDVSLLLFLISPSLLLNFLLTASFISAEKMIPVQGNVYLEIQSTVAPGVENTIMYKLISKQGIFHRTLARDLNFGGKLDSIHVLKYDISNAEIKGYRSRKTFVSDDLDSADVVIDLNPRKQDVIERKL